MKLKEKNALKELSQGELQQKLASARKELLTLHLQHASQQLKNPLKLREVRRSIARLLTFIKGAK